MTPVLQASGVSKRFGGFTAVDDVSMHVEPGEVVGLLGANGAGKTTLIRMLLGLLRTSEGSVDLLGGPPNRDRRRNLGYVSQGLGLYDDLTVRQNLNFISGAYQAAAPALTPALEPHADKLVADLALGLQRQLAFLAALSSAPRVLVLDEPTSGVDALARSALWDTIREQAERGVGVLVTTHYMQEASQCDRLLLMFRGSLVASGSEADIIGDTKAYAVSTDDWKRAFSVLESAGQSVTLAGRDIRVADGDPQHLSELLAANGVASTFTPVPPTIEERMVTLARSGVKSHGD